MKDTIAAIATGITDSGIGIIRISGQEAVDTGNIIFRSSSGKKILSRAEDRKMYYGYVCDNEKDSVVDEVMAVVMRGPKSYTGEDTGEIQCHGGVLVMRKILELAVKHGARLADPGEFTKRAFLNGRIDLSMAEAVMDVIHSQSEYALSVSVNQLKGSLSREISSLREEILYEIAFIESALDDPEHISLEQYPKRLHEKIQTIEKNLYKMLQTADNGRMIKEGIQTVILGKPNVGKSSLLNCLVGEERSIVTEVAGTTRDVIRETIRLGEISLNVVDTAGIRDTEDVVEKIGVERAYSYADEADLLLYVVDGSLPLDEDDRRIADYIQKQEIHKNKKILVLLNKSDLQNAVDEEDIRELFQKSVCFAQKNSADSVKSVVIESISEVIDEEKEAYKRKLIEPAVVKISALERNGLEELEKIVREMFFQGELKSSNEIVITNARHKEALKEAYDSVKLVKGSIEEGYSEDFYSIDLMNAYAALGRILGQEIEDDLVEKIFSEFCMGK